MLVSNNINNICGNEESFSSESKKALVSNNIISLGKESNDAEENSTQNQKKDYSGSQEETSKETNKQKSKKSAR